MKQAIIDIGSNSMRLTLYEVDGNDFKILFKEKVMAGLAGYVENSVLSSEGIECACSGLLDFRRTLESLDIKDVAVFATASLRNVKNTRQAVAEIKAATGCNVEIISGEDEALFGYIGAMRELSISSGAFVDIGGASTEVVTFENEKPLSSASFAIGSLSLYRECVKKLMPGDGALKRMQKEITETFSENPMFKFDKRTPVVCVGGTARAILKIAKYRFSLLSGTRSISAAQLNDTCQFLCRGDRAAMELILKLEPDRIHTIIPGAMIMQHIFKQYDADELVVSKYGVREGYLCQRVLKVRKNDISTVKTES